MINLQRLKKSFFYAGRGFFRAVRSEQNLRIHALVASVVLFMGFFFELKTWEWITIILLIVGIIVLELINTVIERLSDMLKPRLHGYVGVIKDIMAATVLVAVVGAVLVGGLIFFPHLARFLK